MHFPVRDYNEHKGEQAREHFQCTTNSCRWASPTRIRTRERRDEGKCVQQYTCADKGPERDVYAVAPASHIVTTECHVGDACPQQNRAHIERDSSSKVEAEPCVPNVAHFTLGRDRPQKYR